MMFLVRAARHLVRRADARMRRFAADARASVAVEMAFVLPIFATMAFLTWDAGTVYTQYNRSTSNLYSLGDIIATRTSDLTCDRLDSIAELVYDSYAYGNWARRTGAGMDFDRNGALDFRFRITMVRAETRPNGSVRGLIEWEYVRAGRSARDPGNYIRIPDEMQIDGMRFVIVDGFIFLAPTFNYLGIFDMDPDRGGSEGRFDLEQFFPLRFVPNIALVEEPGDRFDDKCKG